MARAEIAPRIVVVCYLLFAVVAAPVLALVAQTCVFFRALVVCVYEYVAALGGEAAEWLKLLKGLFFALVIGPTK